MKNYWLDRKDLNKKIEYINKLLMEFCAEESIKLEEEKEYYDKLKGEERA